MFTYLYIYICLHIYTYMWDLCIRARQSGRVHCAWRRQFCDLKGLSTLFLYSF